MSSDSKLAFPFGVEEDPVLFKQGAEAKIYKATFYGKPAIIKERFSKKYRHPDLDNQIRTNNVKMEVKCLTKCRKMGILVPSVYLVQPDECIVIMEFLDGITVRDYLLTHQDNKDQKTILEIATKIGEVISTMHAGQIIHGDLTTSNMLLRGIDQKTPFTVAMIDFGLSYIKGAVEDKAVDLYVLEKAFLSSHPNSENIFDAILKAYQESGHHDGSRRGKSGGHADASKVLQRLNRVRTRGRKRSMVG